MSLRFVTGSSGAGKSHMVYQELIRESCAHPDRQFLVIVPEQFTMQTQKEIVEMHPRHGTLNLDVLSFNRLAWRVFEEVGGNTLPVLEETGKSLIVQRAAAGVQKELKVLGRTLSRQGSVRQMKSLVSELLQYRVRPEDLEDWIEAQQGRPRLALKLEDIRQVYQAFLDYLEKNYLTAEEIPEILCRVIGESELIKNSVIVLDGFTGFTPVQHQVVRELLVLADRVTVVVTLDPAEPPFGRCGMQNLFYMSREMIRKCTELAKDTHTEIEPVVTVRAGEHSRFAGKDQLRRLEAQLFRYGKRKPAAALQEMKDHTVSEKSCSQNAAPLEQDEVQRRDELPNSNSSHPASALAGADSGEICITEAATPAAEMRIVASRILRMVREEGYRYRDFAVVTGDLATYGREAVNSFDNAGIPCFLDQKQAVMGNLLVEFIRSAIDMEVQNYSYDSVFRFLRTDLTSFTMEEVDELENYCLALGIRSRRQYEETWIRTPENGDPEKLLYWNELRQRFVDETAAFHEGMHERGAAALQRTEVLYAFLVKEELQHAMEDIADAFESGTGRRADPSAAREYRQIYPAVMDMLNKLAEVLGREKMKLSDYQDILDAGFLETSVGLIPPGEDQVMVGDIERTRLKKIRVLFFVGINEGVIPKPVSAKGILSEIDREILQRSDAQLAPTAREEMYRQRFYLYFAMTKPSDRLFLSYSRADRDGTARMPAYLIGVIGKLFPELSVHMQEEDSLTSRLETPAGRMDFMLGELQGILDRLPSAAFPAVARFLLHHPEGRDELLRLLSAARTCHEDGGIGPELARRLYGDVLAGSVTRLEDFAGCAFRHFLDYGLRLSERPEYAFTPADFGTVMHAALERFSRTLKKEKLDWASLEEEDRVRLSDQALEDVVHDYGNTILHSTERNVHMIGRIREMLRTTTWALGEQLRRGDFRPSDFEFAFTDGLNSVSFSLPGGTGLRLHGRIDRLDVCEADGVRYVKVIDYKTGGTTLDMRQLYYGLQLQLVLYMNAALENEQKTHPGLGAEPAGIFYYHIDDPMVKPVEEAGRQEEVLKALKPDGLCRSEREILQLLDRTLDDGVTSSVIPAGFKKDGSLNQHTKAGDKELFAGMQAFASQKTGELGSRIMAGETAASPYQEQDQTACTWCPYLGVCGFDQKIPGFAYRRTDLKSDEEILAEIRHAGETDGSETSDDGKGGAYGSQLDK